MNIALKDFEGPFDLLLHLVRSSKLDIYTVNIKEIIDQYIEYIKSCDKYNIDVSSEYLVMASELVHIKSKMLINESIEEEEEEEFLIKDEDDLRDKLIEYERYKLMSDTFRELEENRGDYYTKLPEHLSEYREDATYNDDFTVDLLINAFLDMQKRINFLKPSTTKVTRKEYSVKKRINEIRDLLKNKKSIQFEELFETVTKENIIVTFLSLLDMSKMKEITIKQSKTFGSIMIESVA